MFTNLEHMQKNPNVNPVLKRRNRVVWLDQRLVINVRRSRMRKDRRAWVNQEIRTVMEIGILPAWDQTVIMKISHSSKVGSLPPLAFPRPLSRGAGP